MGMLTKLFSVTTAKKIVVHGWPKFCFLQLHLFVCSALYLTRILFCIARVAILLRETMLFSDQKEKVLRRTVCPSEWRWGNVQCTLSWKLYGCSRGETKSRLCVRPSLVPAPSLRHANPLVFYRQVIKLNTSNDCGFSGILRAAFLRLTLPPSDQVPLKFAQKSETAKCANKFSSEYATVECVYHQMWRGTGALKVWEETQPVGRTVQLRQPRISTSTRWWFSLPCN